jgi:PKD repeat protein
MLTSGALDYETTASYTVSVTATDPDGLSASVAVTITVTDVEEITRPENVKAEAQPEPPAASCRPRARWTTKAPHPIR